MWALSKKRKRRASPKGTPTTETGKELMNHITHNGSGWKDLSRVLYNGASLVKLLLYNKYSRFHARDHMQVWALHSLWSVAWVSWCHQETRQSPLRQESTDSVANGKYKRKDKDRYDNQVFARTMCPCVCLLYLSVSFVYGLGSVEDGKRPSDDETQLLIENRAFLSRFNRDFEQRGWYL